MSLSESKLKTFNDKAAKRGVVYITRVPPFMKPEKLRHLLSPFDTILRIYLAPEDTSVRAKRLKLGGNKKMNYTEGWIEFTDKRKAKQCAELLNGQTIGGKKRDHYYDDMWTLKYLKHFQWAHLTEKIAYENRIRQQKLRLEISQAKKDTTVYLEKVDQARSVQKMHKRKAEAAVAAGANNNNNNNHHHHHHHHHQGKVQVFKSDNDSQRVRRRPKQKQPIVSTFVRQKRKSIE